MFRLYPIRSRADPVSIVLYKNTLPYMPTSKPNCCPSIYSLPSTCLLYLGFVHSLRTGFQYGGAGG